jgi:hypothetical protein
MAADRDLQTAVTTSISTPSDRGKRSGFYIRPSAAIEKGGGFFVPGLEGPKLRVAISSLTIMLLILNRFPDGYPGYEALPSQIVSEFIALAASVCIIAQIIFTSEFDRQPERIQRFDPDVHRILSPISSLAQDNIDRYLWISNSLEYLTGAQAVVILQNGTVLSMVGEYELDYQATTSYDFRDTSEFPLHDQVEFLSREMQKSGGYFRFLPSSAVVLASQCINPVSGTVLLLGWKVDPNISVKAQRAWISRLGRLLKLR